jgi:hypothetical protein
LSTRFNASVSAGINHGIDDTQWFGNFTDNAGNTHYTFARLDQNTVDMSVRLNYTARPNLTFEFYGEPFATAGTYTNVREVSATPDAAHFDDRYKPYAVPAGSSMQFDYIQLRTNAVMRWEYRPGSALFLVWTHGRERGSDVRQGSWSDDYRDLFQLHPDNTFLIKVAYWLNK